MEDNDLLSAFYCPITHELMQEPVMAGDGHTYERRAIVNWLTKHDRSPVTNERLSSRILIPNHTVKKTILEYCEATGRQLPQVKRDAGVPLDPSNNPAGHDIGGGGLEDEDEDLGQLSWRDGYLSDWLLIVGDSTYAVHRANLAAGPRASSFFRKAFSNAEASGTPERGGGDCASSTNLTDRLPRECWGVMDQVLDFVYDGTFKPTSETVLFLLKARLELSRASVVMAMKELRLRSMDYINVTLTKDSALHYLRHSHLLGCTGTRDVFLSSMHVAAVSFNDYQPQELTGLPLEVFIQLLSHEQLHSYDKTLSNNVCCYARANEHKLDGEALGSLTEHLKMVAIEDAVYLLSLSSRFHLPRLAERCIPTVAGYFDRVPREDLLALDPQVLVSLLSSNDLCVSSEDVIFHLIQDYHRAHPALQEDTSAQMWGACRFCLLSVQAFTKALKDPSIARDLLAEAAVGRMVLNEQQGADDLASFLQASCSVLQPAQASRRKRPPQHQGDYQLIPGCRVAINVGSGLATAAGKASDDLEQDEDPAKRAVSPPVATRSGAVQYGILVVVNDNNRCDVLCDNGSYEVDVPYSDLLPAKPAAGPEVTAVASTVIASEGAGALVGSSTGRRSSNRHRSDRSARGMRANRPNERQGRVAGGPLGATAAAATL